jgi:hypothetical protein
MTSENTSNEARKGLFGSVSGKAKQTAMRHEQACRALARAEAMQVARETLTEAHAISSDAEVSEQIARAERDRRMNNANDEERRAVPRRTEAPNLRRGTR